MDRKKKFTLTDEQTGVIKAFLTFLTNPKEKYMIIQGAAGTGKTTMIKYLLRALKKESKLFNVLLCKDPGKGDFAPMLSATTNKAVSVLRDLSGTDVKTIHSTLGLKVVNDYKTGTTRLSRTHDWKLLFNKLFIIDEASMMDDNLFAELDTAACDSKIVLIGDCYQLAPVKQKQSVMETLDCPRVVMNKVMRHAGTILQTATIFRKVVETGIFKDIPAHADVIHVDGPTFKNAVDSAFTDPHYHSNSAKVLAYANARVQEYNAYIRSAKGLSRHFQKGETVITNNPVISPRAMRPVDSEVTITAMGDPTENRGIRGCYVELDHQFQAFMPYDYLKVKHLLKTLAAEARSGTGSWQTYFSIKETWLDLRPAFASTVHKSQGSSYDRVLIDLYDIGKCRIASDVARMLYVAISRAREKVILYGSLPARYRARSTPARLEEPCTSRM